MISRNVYYAFRLLGPFFEMELRAELSNASGLP